MLFPRIKRTDPEVIYGIFKNAETVDAVDGDCVRARLVADSSSVVQGVEFMYCTAATDVPLGVVSGGITAGEYGKVQVYGYHGNVKAATGTAKAAVVTTATAKSLGDASDANYDPKLTFGYVTKAVSGGRAGIFLKCM